MTPKTEVTIGAIGIFFSFLAMMGVSVMLGIVGLIAFSALIIPNVKLTMTKK